MGPDSWCDICCGLGHTEYKCSNKPKCSYCSGNHRTIDHKPDVLWCTAKQGSLCGHMLERYPNCNRKYSAFGRRCAQKTKPSKAAQQSCKRGTGGWAPTSSVSNVSGKLPSGPGLDCKIGHIRFQTPQKSSVAALCEAKPGLVPINPGVVQGLAGPVGSNVRFCFSDFKIYCRNRTGNC